MSMQHPPQLSWVTRTGPPAWAQTSVEVISLTPPVAGVRLTVRWVDGTAAAPRSRALDLVARQPCDRVQLDDLNHLTLRGDAGGSAIKPGSVRARVHGDELAIHIPNNAGARTLRFRLGRAASFLGRVDRMRRTRGAPPFNVPRAKALIAHAGYTLDDHRVPSWPWIEPHFPASLLALHGTCTGSADGACQLMFFFVDNRYIGTDTTGDAGVAVLWQTDNTVALVYPLWRPGDGVCCPSGGRRVVRFHWNGSKLTPHDPLPPDPNSVNGRR